MVDDSSKVCTTPLVPNACDNKGPVLVYYSFKPFQNSRLEDFAVASTRAYRIGVPSFAVGLPVLVLACIGIAVSQDKGKSEDDGEPQLKSVRGDSDDVPDSLHIVPRD